MSESGHTWTDVALTAIAALPGVIAAVSSLRNGQTLRKNGKESGERTHRAEKKKISKGDWFKPVDLN